MALFSKPDLKVRLKEVVGFAGPIYYIIQVKGGKYGRFFWQKLPGTDEMATSEAYEFATNFSIKNKARFVP